MAQVAEVTLLFEAESDVLRLYSEIEDRQPGRGDEFSREVDDMLGLLSKMPHIGRKIGAPYRRATLSGFQYSLIYTVEGRRVLIHMLASNYESMESILRRLRR